MFNCGYCCGYQVIHDLALSSEELLIDIVREALHLSGGEVKHHPNKQSNLSELIDRKTTLLHVVAEQEERIQNLESQVLELTNLLNQKQKLVQSDHNTEDTNVDPASVHYPVTLQSSDASKGNMTVGIDMGQQLRQSSMYRRLKMKPRKRARSAITRSPFVI